MTLEEIHSFWEPIHKADKIDKEMFDTNIEAKASWILTKILDKDDKLVKLFMFSSVGFDVEKASKLSDRLNSPSQLAEYIHTMFDGRTEDLGNIIMNLTEPTNNENT